VWAASYSSTLALYLLYNSVFTLGDLAVVGANYKCESERATFVGLETPFKCRETVAFLHHRQQSARTTSKNMNFLAGRNLAIKYKVRVKIYKTSAETTPAPHPI
jgi:hypothetical protein